MSQSPPVPPGLAEDLAHWREAWRLRRAHARWVVLWVAAAGQYQAYRLSRKHREVVLVAATPGDLNAKIEQAEQAERVRRAGRVGR
jgi:neutral trehalase